MIKKIWLFPFLSAFVSCNVMDTKPFESYDESLVWGSRETIDAFVMNCYNGTVSNYTAISPWWESLTPNGALCCQVDNKINTVATETGIDRYYSTNFGRFSELRNCNMIIEKVEESDILSDAQKTALIGEGHFLRGMLFFDMARKMGRFVPITRVLDIDDNETFKTPLTTSPVESYKYVIDDFKKAAEKMTESSKPGRANRYAALAMLCRASLQAYAYTKDESYLDLVINSANDIITNGGYTLSSNYGGMFNEESPEDKEIILARYYLDTDSKVQDFDEMQRVFPNLPHDEVKKGSKDGVLTLDPSKKTFDGWGNYFPTQDLVDQYLVIDQKDGQAKLWYETSQFKENVELMSTVGLTQGSIETFNRYDGEKRYIPTSQDLKTGREDLNEYPLVKWNFKLKKSSQKDITDLMYEYRDKRMDATIVRDKGTTQNENLELNMGGNASQGIRIKEDGGWFTTTTGYYWKKHTVLVSPRVYADNKINFHSVVCRYGEVYMNLAEAYLLKNDYQKAVSCLNETRIKHGGLPASTASSLEEAWRDYIRERRVEMAYEEADIYFSYLRWGKYGGYANHGLNAGDYIKDLSAPVYKISITSDRSAACINQLTLLDSWNRKFTPKRYLFPIPQGDLDTRAAYGIKDSQNFGW